jgi:flagellar hook-associated protein 2
MAISSTGLGSGLDVESIVSSLMAVERKPAALLETAATTMKSQLSTYGQLQSYVSAFQDKARALNSTTLWAQTVAASSDATVASVTTGTNTAAGSYSLTVSELATSQTASTVVFPSKEHSLGQGQLTIDLGSWTGDPATFGLKAGSTSVTIDIGPGESSLAAVRDKINAAGAGVTATVIYDATGARLSIRSTETGVDNGFRISATETVPGDDGGLGLSALAYDPEGGASSMMLNQTAKNAKAKLNGLDIESASNTLADVADGLTIKLLKVSASPVDLTVTQDTESMKTKVTEFTTAYNDLANFIATQTKYNADSKVAGKLQGDRTVIGLQSQMREILRGTSTATSAFGSLSQVGLEVQANGTIKIETKKLDAALAKPAELRKLLASSDTTSDTSSGIVYRFNKLADQVLGAEGPLETRTAGIQSSITRNAKRVEAIDDRLAQTEKRLRAQYQALDTNMAKMSSLSSYVSQQLSLLSSS